MNLKKFILVLVFLLSFGVVAQAEEPVVSSEPSMLSAEEITAVAADFPGTLPENLILSKADSAGYLMYLSNDTNFTGRMNWADAPVQATAGGLKTKVAELAAKQYGTDEVKIISETYGEAKVETLYRKAADQTQLAYTISSYVLYNGRIYAFHFGSLGDQKALEMQRREILRSLFVPMQ